MGKKMIFDGNGLVTGSFTVGRVYIALNDDSSEYPGNISMSDGSDAFFIDDNGEGFWESLTAFRDANEKPKLVRPAMTPEARDILNNIHETVGAETRSDSIVEFMDKHAEVGVELCARKQEINELEFKCGAWKDKFFRMKGHLANSELEAREWKFKFEAEKDRKKGWMIYSAIVAAYAIGVSAYCLIQ